MGTNAYGGAGVGYVGLWSGGDGYSAGEWATDAEIFTSLEHARVVMADRYRLGYVLRGANVPHVAEWRESPHGEHQAYAVAGESGHNLMAPAVAMNSTLLLAPRDRAPLESLETDGPYACTHLLEVGPRGGVKTTRL